MSTNQSIKNPNVSTLGAVKTKIFAISGGYFRGISKTASYLESEINAWLNANPGIKIIDIKQSSCGGSAEPSKTIVSIWYEPESN